MSDIQLVYSYKYSIPLISDFFLQSFENKTQFENPSIEKVLFPNFYHLGKPSV